MEEIIVFVALQNAIFFSIHGFLRSKVLQILKLVNIEF